MADFYTNLAATATRLLTKYGQTITIKRVTGKVIDPVTGHVTPGTETTFSPVGILKKYPDGLIDGTRITASDRMLVLDNTVEPLMTDEITLQGQNWNIQEVQTSKPAGTALVYFVRVKK